MARVIWCLNSDINFTFDMCIFKCSKSHCVVRCLGIVADFFFLGGWGGGGFRPGLGSISGNFGTLNEL